MNQKNQNEVLEKIVSLAKRKGFVFQSSEIYGGLNGCWDYGPLGVEMLKNIKEEWWKFMTYRPDVEGLDASILMHPKVWKASGHVENFTDPMLDCKSCKSRYRMDTLGESINSKKKKKYLEAIDFSKLGINGGLNSLSDEELEEKFEAALTDTELVPLILNEMVCPNCGNKGTFTLPRQFNLMFKTFIGPVEDSGAVVYLRPETAQGIFVNFLNVQGASRQKLPFGIARWA